ncbi:MAG: hypothetical protein K2X27_11625 [Candidatus Obscuribacterales bacterium]|nr:hypothetical protein [Candidatus Obscuribacterales bacterium]
MTSDSSANNGQSNTEREKEPYLNWVGTRFPLLYAENLEETYGRRMLDLIVASQREAIPQEQDSRIVIRVDTRNQIYKDLRLEALAQFKQLSKLAAQDGEDGSSAREFLSYLLLCNGYPAFIEMRTQLAEEALSLVRDLMKVERFRVDLHSSVSGIIGYSKHASVQRRSVMLEAFEEYLDPETLYRPGRRELSSILFDALRLELSRPISEQCVIFQNRLLDLLCIHPHPETKVMLSAIANEHYDEQLKVRSREALVRLNNSLMRIWNATVPDQVSSHEFRVSSLAELSELDIDELSKVQGVFNACKALKVRDLSDPILRRLNEFMSMESSSLRLAAAIALANIYAVEPPCEVARKAISVLTDWAINGSEGRYVLDALEAVKTFESISEEMRKKVETAYIAANQKFIFRSAINKSD